MRNSSSWPLIAWGPRSLKTSPEPPTRSFTVLETKNLAATGEIAYSGCDIDGNSANVIVVPNFDFAGMQARTDRDAKRLNAVGNGLRAANCPSGPIECRKNPVAKRFHLSTAEPTKFPDIVCSGRVGLCSGIHFGRRRPRTSFCKPQTQLQANPRLYT